MNNDNLKFNLNNMDLKALKANNIESFFMDAMSKLLNKIMLESRRLYLEDNNDYANGFSQERY